MSNSGLIIRRMLSGNNQERFMTRLRYSSGLIAMACIVLFSNGAVKAQQAPARQGTPARAATAPPPINWPSPSLADGPIVLDTAIQHQIRLTVIKGFNQP